MPTLNIPFANDPEVLSLICQPDIRLRTQNSLRFSELRGCVKVEAAVLGSPPLIVLVVSVDVEQH